MASQFVTAIGAFMGTLIGIAVQEFGSGPGGDGELMPRNAGLWGTSLVSSRTNPPLYTLFFFF
jgi:zinc transporter 7